MIHQSCNLCAPELSSTSTFSHSTSQPCGSFPPGCAVWLSSQQHAYWCAYHRVHAPNGCIIQALNSQLKRNILSDSLWWESGWNEHLLLFMVSFMMLIVIFTEDKKDCEVQSRGLDGKPCEKKLSVLPLYF